MKYTKLVSPTWRAPLRWGGGLFVFTLLAATAGGELTLVEDFESFSDGDTIINSSDWTGASASGGSYLAVNDNSNMVLQFPSAENTFAETAFDSGALADGDTATLFYQFRVDSTDALNDLDQSFGVSGGATSLSSNGNFVPFGAYRAYTSVRESEIQYRDGGGFATAVGTNDVALGTWYSAWLVVEQGTNDTGTYDLYLSEGRTASVGTAVASDIAFRTGNGNPIDRFLLISGGATGANANNAFLDNIYLDNAGESLVNPIPEPTTYAFVLGFLGMAMVMIRRWRRR